MERPISRWFGNFQPDYGKTIGIVEDTNDPLHLGRALVRILEIDGENPEIRRQPGHKDYPYTYLDNPPDDLKKLLENNTLWVKESEWDIKKTDTNGEEYGLNGVKTDDLIWALCISINGAPIKVSKEDRVYLDRLRGDYQRYIITGVVPTIAARASHSGTPTKRQITQREKEGKFVPPDEKGTVELKPNLNASPEEREQSNTLPLEARAMVENEPTCNMIFKTPKGAACYVEEKDELEHLVIVDRLGQELRFTSPMKKAALEDENTLKRGIRTIKSMIPIERAKAIRQRIGLSLLDGVQQGITTDGRFGRERTTIISKQSIDGERSGRNYIMMDASAGTRQLNIECCTNGRVTVQLRIDATTGYIDIDASKLNINTDVNINGNLLVDGKISTVDEPLALSRSKAHVI